MLPILHQSYWRDEAFSVLLSVKNIGSILTLTAKDVSPPFYYLILHVWIKLFGHTEPVTRSLSLIFHFLLVFTCFFLINHLIKNWRISLLGSLAILLNPFLIEYAFETRSYTLFAFLVVTSTFFFLKKKLFLSSVFMTLALLTHNFAVLFFLSFGFFWIRDRGFKKFSESLKLFLLPLVAFMGWFIFLWDQWVRVGQGFWIEEKTSSIFIDSFRAFFQGSKDYPSKSMLYNLAIALAVFVLSFWIAKEKKSEKIDNKSHLALVPFLIGLPFIIVYVISSFWVPIFHERYIIPILPLLIIWATYSLCLLASSRKSLSHVILALSFAYVFFGIQATEEVMQITSKPAINYGVSQILSKVGSNDIIVPESSLNFLETKYYASSYGSDIPVYAYQPEGEVLWYIGGVLFEEEEIIKEYPRNKDVWILQSDGGHYLKASY